MTEEKHQFSKEELHRILNTLGQSSLMSEEKEAVGRCLANKKQKGKTIDDQAIAICIEESKNNHHYDKTNMPSKKKKKPVVRI